MNCVLVPTPPFDLNNVEHFTMFPSELGDTDAAAPAKLSSVHSISPICGVQRALL
jgi:hypothetical protein